ncbi:MAG TPA: hypothetical protein DCM08_05025 [Microscillaceae bacterium]|nr:hypothetical protein [Microscillaceae bacterium]
MKTQHILTLSLLTFLFVACGGAKEDKKEESKKEEAADKKEEKKAFDKKTYVEYAIEGYKKMGEPNDTPKSSTLSYAPEAKDKVRSIDISVDKLNDASYLESEEAFNKYYKTMATNDKATITASDKEGKKVFYYKFEDKMMGKAINVYFLGKENHAVKFTIIEAAKGKLPNFNDLETEINKFVEVAVKK